MSQRRRLRRQESSFVLVNLISFLLLHLLSSIPSHRTRLPHSSLTITTITIVTTPLLQGSVDSSTTALQPQPCLLLLDIPKMIEYIALLQQKLQTTRGLFGAFGSHVTLTLFDVLFLLGFIASCLVAFGEYCLGYFRGRTFGLFDGFVGRGGGGGFRRLVVGFVVVVTGGGLIAIVATVIAIILVVRIVVLLLGRVLFLLFLSLGRSLLRQSLLLLLRPLILLLRTFLLRLPLPLLSGFPRRPPPVPITTTLIVQYQRITLLPQSFPPFQRFHVPFVTFRSESILVLLGHFVVLSSFVGGESLPSRGDLPSEGADVCATTGRG
mmetsp:Transcript_23379/g.48908  ORF Transcript_23379/g.48908 Transcript_23379/m.48908 type:complete len:323 (-) Transcript_23379:167-1135(-)